MALIKRQFCHRCDTITMHVDMCCNECRHCMVQNTKDKLQKEWQSKTTEQKLDYIFERLILNSSDTTDLLNRKL